MMAKLCKDCKHFDIENEGIDINSGRGVCDRFDLVTDFMDMERVKELECVQKEWGRRDDE